MQNFEFLRENGVFKLAQNLFMIKSFFLKIFCVYKSLFLSTSWRLTEIAPDTPAKKRGKLSFLISYLFKYLYHYLITLCEETIVWGKFSWGKINSLFKLSLLFSNFSIQTPWRQKILWYDYLNSLIILIKLGNL